MVKYRHEQLIYIHSWSTDVQTVVISLRFTVTLGYDLLVPRLNCSDGKNNMAREIRVKIWSDILSQRSEIIC